MGLLERVVDKIDVQAPDGCWEWTSVRSTRGYGKVKVDGQMCLAHRIVYELAVDTIPPGLVIDHLCRNTSCVNPDHLEPVTQLENMRRSVGATKTHCDNGHEFTPENTYIRTDRNGSRVCRECNRIWAAKRHG